MGGTASHEPVRLSTDPPVLTGEEKSNFEELWLSSDHRMTVGDFTDKIGKDTEVTRAVFRYLSLDNETIEKEFMESRLVDLVHHPEHKTSFTVAPWETLIEVLGFAPGLVLAITAGAGTTLVTEAENLGELGRQIPALESEFNHSVVRSVLRKPRPPLIANSQILTEVQWRLIRMITSSQGDQDLLYSSAQHGSSFRVLAPAIKFYPGQLVFVFTCSDGRVFGFSSIRERWVETVGRFDEAARDSVLFQLEPELRLRRVNKNGASNCIYFNVSNPHHPVGIGLGGRTDAFRFWLDGTDISRVTSMDVDATFEPRQVLSGYSGDVSVRSVEVFGLSGPAGRESQKLQKDSEAEVRMERKKVDKAKLVENEFDRQMLLSKTFQASNQDRLGTA